MQDVKTLLVLGGTGFIGRNLVKSAIISGFETTVLSSHTLSVDNRVDKVNYLVADVRDIKQLQNVVQGNKYSYVVNLSGYVDHSPFLNGGRNVIDTHFNGLLNVLAVLDWKSIETFIQIGSSDEYGDLPSPQSESDLVSPISAYSFAKSAANQFLTMLNKTESFPVVMLRFFLVYGPGQNKERFLPQIIEGCLDDKTFPTSEGEQVRDFCYIDDVVEGILSTFGNKKSYGEIINIASGLPVKIRDVLLSIVNIIGKGNPDFGAVKYREGENMSLYADCRKAKILLDWEATTSLDIGIEKTVEYCENY